MSKVAAFENHITDLKKQIKLRDDILKLTDIPLFKEVVLEQFCKEDCAVYAQLSADPSITAEARADSLALAQAAGHLRRYFSVKIRLGNLAENTIDEAEDGLNEARAEEGL